VVYVYIHSQDQLQLAYLHWARLVRHKSLRKTMEESVISEFEAVGIAVNDEVASKCAELCKIYKLSEEDVVAHWVNVSISKLGGVEPTVSNLRVLEEALTSEQQKKANVNSKHASPQVDDILYQRKLANEEKEEAEEEDLLNTYGTPRSSKVRPPSSFPFFINPSQKYSSRSNAGDVIAVFGDESVQEWKRTDGVSFTIKLFSDEEALKEPFMYMRQSAADKAIELECRLDAMVKALQDHLHVDGFHNIHLNRDEEAWMAGKIRSDMDGKLNKESLVLEDGIDGLGIPLDVSELNEYSLFPGQSVAVKGTNPTGVRVIAKEIQLGVLPPLPQTEVHGPGLLEVVIAAGPFSVEENLLNEPWQDLVNYLREAKPHILFLLGPFLDAQNALVVKGNLKEPYEVIFTRFVEAIIQTTSELDIELAIIASSMDVHHHPIFPTPPYSLKFPLPKNVHIFSDPCMLDINGFIMGVTSIDVLFHLGKEEVVNGMSSDRLSRLARHLLLQQNFYPLFPPSEEVNLELDQLRMYGGLHVRPHLLVLPSQLKGFIKEVDGCCILNPERLAKKSAGGCFARLEIDLSQGNDFTILKHLQGQVKKI
ncbi:unnamed protein product, partial [Darwinula stevensoni]